MEINFQGQLDKKLFFRAVALASRPAKRNRVMRVIFSIILVGLTVAMIADILVNGIRETEQFRVVRVLLSLVTVSYVLLTPYIRSWRTATRLWHDSSIQATQSGGVTSSGIVYKSSRSQKEYSWQQYSKKQIQPEMIVLLTVDGILTVLPCDFFSCDADWERVKQLVDFNMVEPK
ncbi:MAG: hypothetical protein JXR84_23960 [Anaerolineae bacterium]|nr:hypothetical protein [Anaerolineae bacterium]